MVLDGTLYVANVGDAEACLVSVEYVPSTTQLKSYLEERKYTKLQTSHIHTRPVTLEKRSALKSWEDMCSSVASLVP